MGAVNSDLFGIARPDIVCTCRVEVKLPAGGGKSAAGRPFKVWQGLSDADEATIHSSICDNPILARLLKERKALGTDGSITLSAILIYIDGKQLIERHDIEILYLEMDGSGNNGLEKQAELYNQLFQSYSQAMIEVKKSTDVHMAKMSEGFGTMATAFAEGISKISEHGQQLGKLSRKLERDRRKLTTTLLAMANKSAKAQAPPSSPLDTAIKTIGLIKTLAGDQTDTKAKTETKPTEPQPTGTISGKE